MNILHVTPAYYPAIYWGGPIFSVYALNNALAKLPDITLKVLTTDASGPLLTQHLYNTNRNKKLYPNQEVIFAHRIAGADISLDLLHALPSLIRWADVIHLTGTYSFPTLPTLFLCNLQRKSVVWSPRGALLDVSKWKGSPRKKFKWIWEQLCNWLINPGQVVLHVTSQEEKEASELRIHKAKAVIIPNGVDIPEPLNQKICRPSGKLRLIYMGRIAPIKGIENLLYALCNLKDPSVSLTLYGTGSAEYEASIKRLAASLPFSEGQVNFAGQVDKVDKSRAFYSSDVCVVPSFSENFGMVVAESMAHGIPVIASHGTPWKSLEDRQCGLWVDNSPEALVQAITSITNSPLEEMGARGREWMKAEYGWDSIASRMDKLYRGKE